MCPGWVPLRPQAEFLLPLSVSLGTSQDRVKASSLRGTDPRPWPQKAGPSSPHTLRASSPLAEISWFQKLAGPSAPSFSPFSHPHLENPPWNHVAPSSSRVLWCPVQVAAGAALLGTHGLPFHAGLFSSTTVRRSISFELSVMASEHTL